jgi:hypothetical protein
MPSQKDGIETPSNRQGHAHPIEPAAPVVGRQNTEQDAQNCGQAETREGEHESAGRLLADFFQDGTVRANRPAEIAAEQVAKESRILDWNRLIEPQARPQFRDSLGRVLGVAKHDENRIPG